jgi:hypothetical protein
MELKTTATKIRDNEVEVTFESWHSKYPVVWRLVRYSDRIAVAKPGRCGNFNLSYAWICNFPLNCYSKKILEAIAPHLEGQYLPEDPTSLQVALFNAHKDWAESVAKFLMQVRKEM